MFGMASAKSLGRHRYPHRLNFQDRGHRRDGGRLPAQIAMAITTKQGRAAAGEYCAAVLAFRSVSKCSDERPCTSTLGSSVTTPEGSRADQA